MFVCNITHEYLHEYPKDELINFWPQSGPGQFLVLCVASCSIFIGQRPEQLYYSNKGLPLILDCFLHIVFCGCGKINFQSSNGNTVAQTNKNKQIGNVINASLMLVVINYSSLRFSVSARDRAQWNICEHVDPTATVTSKTAVCLLHQWLAVRLCWCTCSHVLTTHCAHCSRTACHLPRHILWLWCHQRETGELSAFASVFSPSYSQTHTPTRTHRYQTAMTSPRVLCNVPIVVMMLDEHKMIDWL